MELKLLDRNSIDHLISKREGETKLGECIQTISNFSVSDLSSSNASFVLLGIVEDIGPRANFGRAGASTAWDAFLPKFVNIQSNRFFKGDECILLGKLSLNHLCDSNDINDLRSATKAIDEVVSKILSIIYSANKIPIVIGGGHNNSYNNIKALAQVNPDIDVNCINLDPHADFRALEGRHSGNGFSYAFAEGHLKKYAIVGLHENYNSEQMFRELDKKEISYTTYEDIFIRNLISFKAATEKALYTINQSKYGIEIDLDAIENIASSAQTPSGVSVSETRQFIHHAADHENAAYIHLCEGAPSLSPQPDQVGKLLAYLVSDFIKSRKEH